LLRGAKTSEMFSKKYNELKTYGIGADLNVNQWMFYITQLKNIGLVEIAYDENMHFKITNYGNKVLFENMKITFAAFKEKEKIVKGKSKVVKEAKQLTTDEILFDRLKLLRRKIAVEENVPAYIVFSDATLLQMANEKPMTKNELLSIQGIGMQKSESYGDEFITLIKQFTQDQQPKKSTYDETFDLLKSGLSIESISSIRDLVPTTIYSHIAKLYADGYPIKIQDYITIEDIKKIEKILPNFENTIQLKPIYEALNGEIDYGSIRLSICYLEKKIN
jgi:ATP-dependent DNA helicase RecQ